jgi:hypothetical protein
MSNASSAGIMSPRTHFWLRIVGLAVILALQFGPRFWSIASAPSTARVATAAVDSR